MHEKYPPADEVIGELYGTMQTFRKLGFTADDLYVAFGIVAGAGEFINRKCVGVQLQWRGKEFNVHVAPVENDQQFAEEWTRFCEKANEGQTPELQSFFDKCFIRRNVSELIVRLSAKGITPPLGSN